MAFPAKINPEDPMEARSGNPMADISEYPGINPHYLSGSERPELSGRVTPLQNPQQVTTRMGVLLRRPEMSASIPPTYQPNRMFSMEAAKSPIRSALSLAGRQRVPEDAAQLRGMIDFLEGTGEYGPERPAAMTPQEMLEARRGYGRNFISNRQWNQTANSPVMAAAKQGYGGLTNELHMKVPGSIEADQMMENLIPAKQALKAMVKRDPSVGVNVMGRMGARTGALTSAAMGAAGGARAGGLPGAILGGATGLAVPEVLSAPTAKMALARGLYSTMPPKLGRAALQSLLNSMRTGTGGQAQ